MYKVEEIIPYEFTRNIVLQDKEHKQIKVFDDSDLLGNTGGIISHHAVIFHHRP